MHLIMSVIFLSSFLASAMESIKPVIALQTDVAKAISKSKPQQVRALLAEAKKSKVLVPSSTARSISLQTAASGTNITVDGSTLNTGELLQLAQQTESSLQSQTGIKARLARVALGLTSVLYGGADLFTKYYYTNKDENQDQTGASAAFSAVSDAGYVIYGGYQIYLAITNADLVEKQSNAAAVTDAVSVHHLSGQSNAQILNESLGDNANV